MQSAMVAEWVASVVAAAGVGRYVRRDRSAEPSSQQRWQTVCRTAHDLVWELSPEGVLTYLSPATQRVFLATPDELVGRPLLSIIHPHDVERISALLRDCVERQTGWRRVRGRVLRSDGSAVWVESSGEAHTDGGRLLGFTATTHELVGPDAERAADEQRLHRIDAVLRDQAVETVFQPIFSLATGDVVGAEALSRFAGPPEQGPEQWFDDAHDVGLGVELELLAIRLALGRAAALLPDDVYVSVNVTPWTLTAPGLVDVLADSPVDVRRIVLELTEHLSVEDYDVLADAMERLRAIGARLAVDDAGAGFASFRHILRLRPDFIKLDQTMIRGIHRDPARRALTAALVVFALEVGSTTLVAEGIETPEELEMVATLGVDAGQGDYLGVPALDADGWAPVALDGLAGRGPSSTSVGV